MQARPSARHRFGGFSPPVVDGAASRNACVTIPSGSTKLPAMRLLPAASDPAALPEAHIPGPRGATTAPCRPAGARPRRTLSKPAGPGPRARPHRAASSASLGRPTRLRRFHRSAWRSAAPARRFRRSCPGSTGRSGARPPVASHHRCVGRVCALTRAWDRPRTRLRPPRDGSGWPGIAGPRCRDDDV